MHTAQLAFHSRKSSRYHEVASQIVHQLVMLNTVKLQTVDCTVLVSSTPKVFQTVYKWSKIEKWTGLLLAILRYVTRHSLMQCSVKIEIIADDGA